MLSWVSGCFVHSDVHKKDDDHFLLEVQNWKRDYSPQAIGAIQDLWVQQQKINEMVSSMLFFRDINIIEDDITRHCIQIVEECGAEGRHFLIKALEETFNRLLIKRVQRVVLERIHLAAALSCPNK